MSQTETDHPEETPYSDKEEVLLASQGIYDRGKNMYGTELLFRNKRGDSAIDVGESEATSEVLINHCASITRGLDHFKRPAFVNVGRNFLLSEAFFPVDAQFVVVELVERVKVDQEIVDAVRSWKRRGFRFALDDFEFSPSWAPLLELADIVKIDVLDADPNKVYHRKRALEEQYQCLWLAERIETEEVFDYYKEQGFDLFQGYFLARPKTIMGKSIRPHQSSAMEILQVTSMDSPLDNIASTVEKDPILSLQLLKIINSSLYSLSRPVESVKEAVVFLGVAQLRKWALLLSLLSASDNCAESHRLILSRAKFCELYAGVIGEKDPDRAFVVGLLSGIDILLGVDVNTFVKMISLSDDITLALTKQQGRLGKILAVAIQLEKMLNMQLGSLSDKNREILGSYQRSFEWTEDILRSLK